MFKVYGWNIKMIKYKFQVEAKIVCGPATIPDGNITAEHSRTGSGTASRIPGKSRIGKKCR